ncbi:hypothetical protein Mapa_011055 [Marchantia paleacea]|nr:hypothetical protein Mapa_011055 [Marchantia paleacea]
MTSCSSARSPPPPASPPSSSSFCWVLVPWAPSSSSAFASLSPSTSFRLIVSPMRSASIFSPIISPLAPLNQSPGPAGLPPSLLLVLPVLSSPALR